MLVRRFLAVALMLLPALAFPQGLTLRPPGISSVKRTNYAKNSNSMTVGTAGQGWTLSSTTATTESATEATTLCGGGTWGVITNSLATGTAFQGVTGMPSSTTFAVSLCVMKASGTGYAGVGAECGTGTLSVCSCTRSDGGACSAIAATGVMCLAEVSNLTTSAVRVTAVATCTLAGTSLYAKFYPGQFGVATGTTRMWGAQAEAALKSSPICVTTTAAKTCK